jgi:hypothetical protein
MCTAEIGSVPNHGVTNIWPPRRIYEIEESQDDLLHRVPGLNRWSRLRRVRRSPNAWHHATGNFLHVLAVSVQLFLEQFFFVADAQSEH